MDEGNPSATKTTLIVARGYSTALLGNTFVHLRRPRVQRGALGQHFRTLSSPEGAARLPWATLSYIFVARGCSTAPLGNTFVLYRRPRVQHGSLGQHFRTSSSPKGAARLSWATLSYIFVARGCSMAPLGQHFRTLSSSKGTARLSWATLSYIFVARGCSTAPLGNTFVHLRRPRVQHGTLERHLRAFPPPEGTGQKT